MRARGMIRTDPRDIELRFIWDPERLIAGSQAGDWDAVDMPRRQQAIEYRGQPLRTLEFELLRDGYHHDDGVVRSVHPERRRLERMATPVGGRDAGGEPPVLQILRMQPSWVRRTRWVITELTDLDDDYIAERWRIVRCRYRVRMLEWRETEVAEIAVEDVRREVDESSSGGAARTHTVVAGDTLWALSDRFLGDPLRWTEIRDKNGIRDERNIQIGTVLKIPAK